MKTIEKVIPELSNALAFQLLMALEHESTAHVDNVYMLKNGQYSLHEGGVLTKMVEVDASTARGQALLKAGKKQEKKTLPGKYVGNSEVIKKYSVDEFLEFKDEILLAYKEEKAIEKAAQKAAEGEENHDEKLANAIEKLANNAGGNSAELDKKAGALSAKEKELADKELELQIKAEEQEAKEKELEEKQAEIDAKEAEETAEERKADLVEAGLQADAEGNYIAGTVKFGPEILTMPEKDFKKALRELKAALKATK